MYICYNYLLFCNKTLSFDFCGINLQRFLPVVFADSLKNANFATSLHE